MKCEKCGKELVSYVSLDDSRTGKSHLEYIDCKCLERTELIRQLGEKACDRNDEVLKKMEECKVDKNQIIVNGRIFPFNFPVIFYGEAVSLAGGEDGRLYTVTYSVVRGNDGKQGSLVEGQSTEIVDGMVLNVSQTDKA